MKNMFLAIFSLLVFALPVWASVEHDKQFIDALESDDCETIRLLLDQKLIAPDKKLGSMYPLTLASSRNNICAMRALLKSGASINGADGKSEPILFAYMAKKYEAVKFLVEQGAIVPETLNNLALIETSNGNTAAADALGLDIAKMKKSGKKKTEQEANKIEGPGYFSEPGYYSGPCLANYNDADPKNTHAGNSGSSVLIRSVFKDIASGPVHVKMVEPPQCKPVYLDSPHGYIMTTKIYMEEWIWLCSATEDIRKDCPYVTKNIIDSAYYEMISTVKKPDKKGACQKQQAMDRLAKRPWPPKGLAETADAENFNEAVIAALKQFNKSASSEFTTVTAKSGDLTRFILYISRDDCLLPSREIIQEGINNNCVKPRSLEGANRLIFGAVQQVADKTRVTTRVVELETGLIMQAGKGDADGTDRKAISTATQRAFNSMGFKPSCAKPMKNDLSDEAAKVQ